MTFQEYRKRKYRTAPDVEKIKHAVEFYCLEESDSFIDFVVNNKKKA